MQPSHMHNPTRSPIPFNSQSCIPPESSTSPAQMTNHSPSFPTQCNVLLTISALNSDSLSTRIAATRNLKNHVVGNPTNKRLYLANGSLNSLILAATHPSPELAEQAVAAIGSLACFLPPLPVQQLVRPLLRCLFAKDVRPVNAAARALKLIVCSDAIDIKTLVPSLTTHDVADRLIELIVSKDDGIAEVCAVVVSRITVSAKEAIAFEHVHVIPALVHLLCRTNHERCIEACLTALSALSSHCSSISQQLTAKHRLVTLVIPLTHSPTPTLRLAACRLLTIFHADSLLPSGLDGVVTIALVHLLHNASRQTQITAAYTLAHLVGNSPELQAVATKNQAVSKLTSIFYQVSNEEESESMDDDQMADVSTVPDMRNDPRSELCTSALTALAAVTRNIDSSRDAVVAEDALSRIVNSLKQSDDKIVLAAVECIRSLSRSVKIVRHDIADENIGTTLLDLLSSKNIQIQRCASATLCNLVLEFSPIRTSIILHNGIATFVDLLGYTDDELRKNALWALKNLLFKANSETKTAVMKELGYTSLQSLCADKQPRVRELAMTIVRNLACSGSADSQREQLDALFAATGNELISLLSAALTLETENSELAVQALYVVCNIASGTEEHKASLIDSEIPRLILQWTSHKDERARIAAVWCAINLSWKDRPLSSRNAFRHRRSHHRPRVLMPRLELLRRQHLPPPSSPAARRFLERAGVAFDSGNNAVMRQESSSDADIDSETQSNLVFVSSLPELDRLQPQQSGPPPPLQTNNVPKSSGYEWRIERLRELGFEGRLRSLTNDPHIEVQGRARAALELFDCGDVHPLDYNPSALLEYDPASMVPRHASRALPQSFIHRVLASDSSSAGSS